MRRVAGTALSVASLFLGLVAVMINAPALFYMSFALIATIVACNIQSSLATKALRIERIAPKSVHVGELVTVEIVLWSEQKIKRPLVTIFDQLPARLASQEVGTSLPVAPAYDLPVRTMYQFRPAKRGRFRWKNVKVTATDALGLTTKTVGYETDPTEIVVIPQPIPVNIDLPSSAGWGINEAVSGQSAGAGIEPRGIRQYSYGDSLRHVHWRSSARTGVLQVKEFQAGSQGSAAFVLQRTQGTDIGKGEISSLDVMCGHALYLAEQLLRQGVDVSFPNMEVDAVRRGEGERREEIALALGLATADRMETIGQDLRQVLATIGTGATVYVLVSVDDESLQAALQSARGSSHVVVLVYDAGLFDVASSPRSAVNAIDTYRQSGSAAYVMPGVTG